MCRVCSPAGFDRLNAGCGRSLAHTHTHSHPPTPKPTITLTLALALTLALTLTLTLTHTHTHTHTLIFTHPRAESDGRRLGDVPGRHEQGGLGGE